jgi:hypothetical protein
MFKGKKERSKGRKEKEGTWKKQRGTVTKERKRDKATGIEIQQREMPTPVEKTSERTQC